MDEMLEIWDWRDNRPTGEKVSRKKAHKEGIPHEAIHLWIVRMAEREPEILFQHRSPEKENYPDCLDITVGGHVPFSFNGNKIIKEAHEEIGIIPEDKDFIDLGWYKYQEKNEHIFQREFQHIYLLYDNRSLDAYRFNDGEVTAIYAVPKGQFALLMAEDIEIHTSGYNGRHLFKRIVTRNDFHPQLFDKSMKDYMDALLSAIDEYFTAGKVKTKMPMPF